MLPEVDAPQDGRCGSREFGTRKAGCVMPGQGETKFLFPFLLADTGSGGIVQAGAETVAGECQPIGRGIHGME